MTQNYEELLMNLSARSDTYSLVASVAIRALIAERDRLRKSLEFYANPEIYKPHPHGPAFDRRDLSYHARAALGEKE
jgi:hypothetical protein